MNIKRLRDNMLYNKMPRTPIDYSKGLIYKIVCKDPNVKNLYVGSTTNFTQRKYKHHYNLTNENEIHFKLKVYQFIRDNGGWENWDMVQIETFPCNNLREILTRERYWFEELKADLNGVIPMRTEEEVKKMKQKTDKEYKKKNLDDIKMHQKEYWDNNKIEINERRNARYQENREKILLQQKIRRDLNKEKTSQRRKEYRQENKEKLSQLNKIKYEANKEKILSRQKELRKLKKEQNDNITTL